MEKTPTEMVEKEGTNSIVLYSGPHLGILAIVVELGKLFTAGGLDVTIVVVEPPFNSGSIVSFISSASVSYPTLTFHRLPTVIPSHTNYVEHESLHLELIRLANPHLLTFLSALQPPPAALVLDFLCADAIDVATQVGIPFYFFCTNSASSLTSLLYLHTQHSTITQSFADLGSTLIHIPGILPIPANHLPAPVMDRNGDSYPRFVEISRRLTDAAGIIVNTFEWLEPRALRAIRDGHCVADAERPTPPIHCVGPLVAPYPAEPSDRCLAWLDTQPKGSVVFMCFGSLGRLSAEQIKEIATGLERSEQRFLWVVRSPPRADPSQMFAAPGVGDVEDLLPRGFIERTRERGLVVGPWAPQRAVLHHAAIGGFVTHLGWNSVLEALWEGVAMLGWPLYAEQRMNRAVMVEDLGMAVGVEGYVEGLVGAEEVERKVRELMEGEVGRAVREKLREARGRAQEALADGGTSRRAMEELVRACRRN